MSISYAQGIDEMSTLFWQNWNSILTSNIVGYVPEVRWPYVEEPSKPNASKFWVRVSFQTVRDQQAAFSDQNGKKRYTCSGLIFFQIFAPKQLANAGQLGRQFAQVVKTSVQGEKTNGGVWFRNTRISDIPPEELFYRFNVVSEFEFDEIA